ncbi:PTS sugar transporter subunit IIA [Enterococcus camelliae]|uniref:PTS sugar transporter subunit IIA n=1 Tax=Enterococcus camelliae TaxID=453959 RepID=A0ABW5TLT8_9ENTE
MNIDDLIIEDLIWTNTQFVNVEDLFNKSSIFLNEKKYVVKEYGFELIKREKKYPTGLHTKTIDVAIPHTDAQFVKTPFIFVIRTDGVCEFQQMGSLPDNEDKVFPKFIFILGFNKNEMQLQLLSTLMKLFNDEQFMNKILDASKKDLYKLLKEKIKEETIL